MAAERPEGTNVVAAEAGAVPNAEAPRAARVFVGLKVTSELARELARLAAAVEHPNVRRVAPDDIHLTLVPPWNETSIAHAVEKVGRVTGRFGPFQLTFQHVGYGPQPKRPRLLWVDCAADNDLATLRAALIEVCGHTDERPFRPHVTLARIHGNGTAVARRHPVDQHVLFTQRVESIELFQSPPPGKRGYRVLASLALGKASPPASST